MFSFCRFCAQEKNAGELVTNLQNVLEMYTRICPKYDSESSHQLPQRICGPCSDQLIKCWNFIEQIESAEKKLTELIVNRSKMALPMEEVIVCENSIIIFEPRVELLKSTDIRESIQEAEMMDESDMEQSENEANAMNESDTEEQSDDVADVKDESYIEHSSNQEAGLSDDSDIEHSTNQKDQKIKKQEKEIDEEAKRQAYILNRKRRRMKYVKFFSDVPRNMILADGTISDETVTKLEQTYPEMKTISWQTCKYRCDKCPEIVEGPNQFFIHFQSKHFDVLDSYRFPCYNCNDVHDSLFKLNRHIATKHYIHLRYRCSMCPKMYFWNLALLDKHQSSHPKPKFDCNLCNKTGLYKSGLASHFRYCHLLKERPDKFEKYICDICKVECISKGRIKSHMVSHSTTKNFICHFCAQRFATKGQLKCHIDAVHTVSQNMYTCPIENCGKQFSLKMRVLRHVQTHGPKQFKCEKCGIVVASSSSLKCHQLIHDDKRPHKCGMCEKTFRLAQSLKVHERVHTGVTPFICPKCPYSSANWGNLEKHTKRIHSISMKKNHSARFNIKKQNHEGPKGSPDSS